VAAALLCGVFASGCGERYVSKEQREQDAVIRQITERYPQSPRLRAILQEQQTYTGTMSGVKFLAENDIKLELSAVDLPSGLPSVCLKTAGRSILI
jgi:hypothetical protein